MKVAFIIILLEHFHTIGGWSMCRELWGFLFVDFVQKVKEVREMPAKTKTDKKKVAKKLRPKVTPKAKRGTYTPRKSIVPGAIAIMLAGRFRGKRVVILKALEKKGTVAVTGPFKINGVPLRRVDSRYIIATSTKVNLDGTDFTKVKDEIFKRPLKEKPKKSEGEFMGDKAKAKAEAKSKKTKKAAKGKAPNAGKVSDERLALQKSIDTAVLAALKKDPEGGDKKGYLKSIFQILPGTQPHRMKF